MPQYTPEEFASLLTRTYAPHRPRVVWDTNDKGTKILEFILPHPTEPRLSVSLQSQAARGYADTCSLRFGQAEITGYLDPNNAIPAIDEIIGDRLVAILRYKNQDAYDSHRPTGKAGQWLYQITDDEDDDTPALEKMLARLKSPAGLMDKLSGKTVGVFEVLRWSGSEILKR